MSVRLSWGHAGLRANRRHHVSRDIILSVHISDMEIVK